MVAGFANQFLRDKLVIQGNGSNRYWLRRKETWEWTRTEYKKIWAGKLTKSLGVKPSPPSLREMRRFTTAPRCIANAGTRGLRDVSEPVGAEKDGRRFPTLGERHQSARFPWLIHADAAEIYIFYKNNYGA